MADVTRISDISGLKLSHQLNMQARKRHTDFAEALKEQYGSTTGVQFSKHAIKRMESRGVVMTQGLMDRLNQAVGKARSKGSRNVAVIGRENAFIVNVPNNSVITTMTENEMRENIFTNIDSAVIM